MAPDLPKTTFTRRSARATSQPASGSVVGGSAATAMDPAATNSASKAEKLKSGPTPFSAYPSPAAVESTVPSASSVSDHQHLQQQQQHQQQLHLQQQQQHQQQQLQVQDPLQQQPQLYQTTEQPPRYFFLHPQTGQPVFVQPAQPELLVPVGGSSMEHQQHAPTTATEPSHASSATEPGHASASATINYEATSTLQGFRDLYVPFLRATGRGDGSGPAPQVMNRPLNMFQLWHAVWRRGGYREVVRTNEWRKVFLDCTDATHFATNTGYYTRLGYEKEMLDFEKYIRSGGTKMPARIAATGGTGTAAAARKPPGRKPSAAGADTGAGSPSSSMRTTTGRRKPVGRRSTAATGSGGANAGRGTKSTAGTDLEDESMADSDEDFAALQRPYRSTRGGGASADGDGALILDEGMMDGNALYEEAVEFEDVLNVRTGLLKEKDEKVVGDVAAFIAALDANAPAGPPFATAQEQLEWDNYCEARMREMRAHYRKLRRVLAKLDMKLSALTGGEQSAADSSIVTQGEDGPGTSFSSPGASSAQSAESNNSSPGDNEDYVDPAATSVAASPSSGRPARRKAAAAAPSVYAEALAAAEDASLTESELDEVSGTRTTKRQRRSVVRL